MTKKPTKIERVKRVADKVDRSVDKVLKVTDWLGRK
jgi:hypothetical protein